MDVWEEYDKLNCAREHSRRDESLSREKRMISQKLKDNLSYQDVLVDDIPQNVAIINSDNLNEKTILSLPEESIKLGGLVTWMGNHWLVTEKDANSTVYTRAKMIQCNHLLKWVSVDGIIHEQWCIVEDGTKYMSGEFEDRNFVVARGDSRIAITIARNEETVKFDRESRFLVDDPDTPHKLAYLLTKPLKAGFIYNKEGVFKFVLQEVTATAFDNHELGIADYYRHFPKFQEETPENGDSDKKEDTHGKKKVWL